MRKGDDLISKQVFAIELEKCEKCLVKAKAIASIEDDEVIGKILKHLRLDEASRARNRSPVSGLYHPARYWMSAPFKPPLWVDQESLDYDKDEIIELTINLVVLLTEAQKREIA